MSGFGLLAAALAALAGASAVAVLADARRAGLAAGRLSARRPRRSRAPAPLVAVGRHLAPLVGIERPVPDAIARRLGAAAAALVAVPAAPVLALSAAAALAVPPLVRRRTATDDDASLAALPEVLDLLAIAVGAGLAVDPAVRAVARRAPPPWGPALGEAAARAGRGERLPDALDVVVSGVGDLARPLVAVLRSAVIDGAPLGPSLDRLAADARDRRRRRAEVAARRVPVRLLLPLVTCSLPAFALLTVVPTLAGALRGLRL